MASIDDLKSRIDLHDLAEKLGLKRGVGKLANYHSPAHDDKSPSLSVFTRKGSQGWKDHSAARGGTCIDLVMYVEGCDTSAAIKRLHELYGIPFDTPAPREQREKSRAEFIADRCMAERLKAIDYLAGERGIHEDVARRAIEKGAVGYNDYVSPKVPAGEHGHGGPAVAFVVKTLNPGHVVAVDMRYLNPAINGGTKTQCQGEKQGYGWTSDIKRLLAAKTIYLVESPINALSIECCHLYDSAAFAIRGTGNAGNIDFSWARGKQMIIVMDNDEPFPEGHAQAGFRPGLKAAWQLHERLTAMDISALLVDQEEWQYNDVNDILKKEGADVLKRHMVKLEPWLIPGMPASRDGELFDRAVKRRIYLPYHHDLKYWRYRVRPEFTSYVAKVESGAEGEVQMEYTELAGFRVASISRVTIASATATMSGDEDSQAHTMFAVSVQTTRHGAQLLRKVVDDDKLHNIDTWKRFGPVWNQAQFLRMINILENAAHLGARHAANFVGLCWREGRLIVNEGPDCYFTNPDQQCPYHNLTFPSGSRQDARKVIEAYQHTFERSAALLALVWGLGGHLKVLLGFWPHMQMQAKKGMGKSTLIKRLERSIGFTMFSGQSLQTEFRLLTSISHTSHPIGWEEISARRQEILNKATALLQENYQYTVNRRGSEMTEFLLSAPVLLAGEDVPMRDIIGKLVRTELKVKGPLMPEDLPRFPVREWLEFLTGFSPAQVRGIYSAFRAQCLRMSRATEADEGATRMAGNYAALLTAWRLLCEFADIDVKQGNFPTDLVAGMNAHINETSADREPWVWIMETLLNELATSNFKAPYQWGLVADQECLIIRTSDIMHHLSSTPALREAWNALPIKSDRVFKRQLLDAEVIINDSVERTIGMRRVAHMAAISLARLADYSLYAAPNALFETDLAPA
ncbi:toprim domain-containing protein [Propionivibrio sp.]|uniref:toprim domain-containing protein n=1 Tax=Propionivibrio sp. TaxID=2212460 RepID=UPI0039E2398F